MLIKNETELRRVMQQAAKQAVEKAQEDIRACIDMFVKQYYAEYNPKIYKRTYQFLDSITKTNVKVRGTTITCEVYINTALNYNDNTETVLDIINAGYHGNTSIPGTAPWQSGVEMVERMNIFFNSFKQSLIAQGFDVK